MGTHTFEQRSLLSDACDGGLFLRIQKRHVDVIKKHVKDRKVKVEVKITY